MFNDDDDCDEEEEVEWKQKVLGYYIECDTEDSDPGKLTLYTYQNIYHS
jgi:hypothetical protein